MSKIKMSFSLILAIFLVGILSTAAFAKDPYGLKPTQVQGTMNLLVNFTGNTAAGDTDSTTFDLHVYDPSDVELTGSPYTGLTITSNKGSKTITGLKSGVVYKIQLTHASDATVLSTTTGLVTDAHNTGMYAKPDTHVDLDGSGLKNANQTGFNNTRKQRSGQKVHGFYQNNTNSCASCHQTHTGADNNLLFKEGTYSTCSACHDGTTGAYNSFAPVSEENAHSIAGTFNVQTANHNGSLHTADGSLNVSAAPGGNTGAATGNAQWGQEFDCASCHAPHGNGSAGATGENNLNLDPLGWGSVTYVKGSTDKDVLNGKLFKNIPILNTIPTASTPLDTPYILVKTTADADQTKVDANIFFKRAGVKAGDNLLLTYRWDGGKYVADYSLWLQEKGYPYKADTILYNAAYAGTTAPAKTADITRATDVKVVWRDGFAFGAGVANVQSANVSFGVDVETTDDIASLFDSANPKFIKDSGTQMSKYCSACHTDYLSATRTNNTGLYSQAHRHQTGTDSLTCVRCHFGHGSEAQIMKTSNDQTYYDLTAAGAKFDASVAGNAQLAIDYLKDPNPSSALKRYTGMAVCYACHGNGSQFLSNQNNVDHPKFGQPGTLRTDLPQ
jgi:predicted CXXCH cytochrome family protein